MSPPPPPPTPPVWEDAFDYPDGDLAGNNGWAGLVGDATASMLVTAHQVHRDDDTIRGTARADSVPAGTFAAPRTVTLIGTPSTVAGGEARFTFGEGSQDTTFNLFDMFSAADGTWSMVPWWDGVPSDEFAVPLANGVEAMLTFEITVGAIQLFVNGVPAAGWSADAMLDGAETGVLLYSEQTPGTPNSQCFRLRYAAVTLA